MLFASKFPKSIFMENNEYKILLVDDEPDIIIFLSYNLKKEGFMVYTATNGKEAINIARKEIPHLIILDVMMPEMSGVDTCFELKQIPELQNTLIIFLSAKNDYYTQIAGFDTGADDFIAKPIKPRLLIMKINALLKRQYGTIPLNNIPSKKLITVNDLIIDQEEYIVYKDHKRINMPKKEFELLTLLALKPNKVFTRDEILTIVWKNEIVCDRTVDVHISKIRIKLNSDNIKTIKGVGYKYEG